MSQDLERIAKYEAWCDELERQIVKLHRERRGMWKFFALAFATAPIGFIWSKWIALAIAAIWIILGVTGTYIAGMHEWDYRRRLDRALDELDELREDGNASTKRKRPQWRNGTRK